MPARNARAGTRGRRPGYEGPAFTRVAEIQRQRLLAAMALVASERGAPHASVAHVVSRAGVSRRTFYELFADREECFLAAFDQAVKQATVTILPAYESQTRWRERIRAGLTALLAFLDTEPGMAQLVVVEALGAGPRALEHRTQLLAVLIAAVDGGWAEVKGREPQPLTAEGVVGAVFAVIHARIVLSSSARPDQSSARRDQSSARPDHRALTDLFGELMGMIVLPYLGPAAAQKERGRPAPPLQTSTRRLPDPLEGLKMRLTYRTLRALAAVAANPGASNRKLADAAGIVDQGQASKLLTRLEDLGLIENTGDGHAKGARNAWVLTSRGEQVAQSMD
jgi:AcrR family transcriptional regulator/DNA-binding MarR family transcriptional regulator